MTWRSIAPIVVLLCAACGTPHAFTRGGFGGIADDVRYAGAAELAAFYAGLSDPPRYVRTIDGLPAPPIDWGPLLAWIHAGPGGGVVTQGMLEQLTAPFVAWAATGPTAANPLLNTPEAHALFAALQGVLQPLGLWNGASAGYLQANGAQLVGVLLDLYAQLIATGSPDRYVVTGIDRDAVLARIRAAWGSGPLRLAEDLPGLIHQLTAHEGYTYPRVSVYGSLAHGYSAGIGVSKGRRTHTVNDQGYVVHDNAGAGQRWQGADDVSLAYYDVEVIAGKCETLWLHARDRYALRKLAAGGDVRSDCRGGEVAVGHAGVVAPPRGGGGDVRHRRRGGAVVHADVFVGSPRGGGGDVCHCRRGVVVVHAAGTVSP